MLELGVAGIDLDKLLYLRLLGRGKGSLTGNPLTAAPGQLLYTQLEEPFKEWIETIYGSLAPRQVLSDL